MTIAQSVKESIDILRKAQELDREIYRAKELRNEIPALRDSLKQELEAEKNRLKELEAELKKAQLKQKEKEGELSQKETQVKKLEGQLAQLKTNKEYTAMQQEIASLKADDSLIEEDIIKLIDQVEAAEEEVKKEKERLKIVEKNFQEKEAEISKKEKDAIATFEGLQAQRNDIVGRVPADVKELYEKVVIKRQGVALAKIKGEVCGACQLKLRPQIIDEVRLAKSVIVCETCTRILYFEE